MMGKLVLALALMASAAIVGLQVYATGVHCLVVSCQEADGDQPS